MKVPMKISMKQPMKRSMNAAFTRNFSILDGLTNYISNPEYTPTGVNFTLRLKVRFDAGSIGQFVTLLSDTDSGTERFYKTIGNNIHFDYIDSGGSSRSVVLAGLTIQADTDYEIAIVSSGSGVILSAGSESATNANVIDPADVNIINIAANNTATANFLGGRIWDIEYTDHSFIQNGDFLQGNGADLYVDVGDIPLVVGDSYSFDYRHTAGGAQTIVAASGAFMLINGSSILDFGSSITVEVDGTPVADLSQVLADGQIYNIVATVISGTNDIVRLLASGAPSSFSRGIIGDFLVTKANGDTYHYTLKDNDIIDNGDGTGIAVNRGNTGPSFNGAIQNFAPSDLVAIANNSRFYPVNEPADSDQVIDTLGDGSTNGTYNGTRVVEQG